MPKPFFLLLFCYCLFYRVVIANDVKREYTLGINQQDSVDVYWYNTQDSVFELRTAAQLRGLAELVNTGIDFYQQEVRLTNDIFLNDTTGYRDWEHDASGYLEQWTPIGTEEKPFCGTFDGRGHTIYGLYINRGMASYYQGLFGLVLDGAIRNVQMKDAFIKAHDHVGGIAGMIGYTSEIRGSSFQGKVIGTGHMVGGIVGKAEEYNRIIDCGNMGDVQGQRRVGGIVGSFAFGEFYNCFNRGHIKGRHEEVGGLIGVLLGGRFADRSADAGTFEWAKGVMRDIERRRKMKARELRYGFANNYNIGTVTGEDKVGGLIGAFLSFALQHDTTNSGQGTDLLDVFGLRDQTAISVGSATNRGTFFANCYNAGEISARFPVYTDGLIGHYGWGWRPAVYLLDERGDSCFWSDSSVVLAELETWHLPRDMRSFELPQAKDIYSLRSPKVFEELADDTMQTKMFVDRLNIWIEKQKQPFRRWRADQEHINRGYPIFEPEGGLP